MADKKEPQGPGFFDRIKKIFGPKNDESPPETKAIAPVKPRSIFDDWQQRFDTLYVPEEIRSRAKSYGERQQFLARSDEENLAICQEKRQFVDQKFDKMTVWSF